MAAVHLETTIDAPRDRVFDLARSVDAHVETMDAHGEEAVDGVTSGLLEAGDRVTWEACHFGVRQRLEVEITELERPVAFSDKQVSGAFASLVHDHVFERLGPDATRMVDDLQFSAPFGPLGRAVEGIVLERYMRRLLRRRNERLREIAEGDEWQQYVG